MGLLRKFVQRTPPERRLFLGAFVLLAVISVALRVLPFRLLTALLGTHGRRRARADGNEQQIIWAIKTARRFVPGVTCLVESLAAEKLLRAHGHAAELHIGITSKPRFQAHAWVESGGHILLGKAADQSIYTSLPPLRRGSGA